MRSTFAALALISLLGCGAQATSDPAEVPAPDAGGSADGTATSPPEAAPMRGHAERALEALLVRYWRGEGAGFAEEPTYGGAFTGYWIYAQALDAVVLASEQSGGERWHGWIETLYQAQKARGFGRDFYDDENWMALALARAYRATDKAAYLESAIEIYGHVMGAWDETCCGEDGGGLWWDVPQSSKATAINAGAVVTGVLLSELTGEQQYLDFAIKAYDFWRDRMVDADTGQVFDHIDPDGSVVAWSFTYNEGLWVGAGVALYGATSDSQYLADAEKSAGYLISQLVAESSAGNILHDGDDSECRGDCPMFKGIAYRYLAELAAESTDPDLRAWLSDNVQSLVESARDERDLYTVDWRGPSSEPKRVGAHISAVLALQSYAALAGQDGGSSSSSRFEAEEAVLINLGLEDQHGEFSGWGYVAGWKGDGQWLDFRVPASAAGSYRLTFYYAAGAGNASRFVYINGSPAVDNFVFPGTETWDHPSTQSPSVTVNLKAGDNTISVIYNSSKGSENYLNLDALEIAPAE